MKTDKEFKNEVYARASKERARIKKRNRVIMTAVPCFVIALTAATAAADKCRELCSDRGHPRGI